MENPMVKCSIANCEYWEQGNNCNAEVIMIEVNAHANKPEPQAEHGQSYDTRHRDSASNVTDTCCHTFSERAH
ncbi:DUF1540 domain-containing protein [Paenibacillus puerhi]|uniref:DUF1540 domain-containing protein n=1 Tax=Paenibacillus puerhi TaxID=2692622 RepID=UPI001356F5B3|nr:DUF1540 domain-containing protein [Paenibacillus puerhi]